LFLFPHLWSIHNWIQIPSWILLCASSVWIRLYLTDHISNSIIFRFCSMWFLILCVPIPFSLIIHTLSHRWNGSPASLAYWILRSENLHQNLLHVFCFEYETDCQFPIMIMLAHSLNSMSNAFCANTTWSSVDFKV